MAAENAIKLYEIIDQISEDDQTKLESVFKSAVESQLGNVKQAIKSVGYGQIGKEALKGIDPSVIKSYGEYFKLLQNGEAEVLPKLFNAFKNIDTATADAQQRLNTAVRESSNLSVKESNATNKTESSPSDMEGAIGGVFQAALSYNADDYVQKEEEARLELEKALNNERLKDFQDTEQQKVDAVIKAGEKGKEEAIKNWNEIKAADRQVLDEMVEQYSEYGAKVGESLGQALAEGNITAKEAAKQVVLIALDALEKYAFIAMATAAVDSVAKYGPLLGGIRTAIQIALIEGAIAAAKGAIKKHMYTGGYTGDGGKYQVAGIVHKGEYVINSETVANPAFRPMIESMENYRLNGNAGYVNGGGPELPNSISSGSSSIMKQSQYNDNLKKNNLLLEKLLKHGVTTRFSYREADNVQKGLDDLDQLRSNVSL